MVCLVFASLDFRAGEGRQVIQQLEIPGGFPPLLRGRCCELYKRQGEAGRLLHSHSTVEEWRLPEAKCLLTQVSREEPELCPACRCAEPPAHGCPRPPSYPPRHCCAWGPGRETQCPQIWTQARLSWSHHGKVVPSQTAVCCGLHSEGPKGTSVISFRRLSKKRQGVVDRAVGFEGLWGVS